MEGDNEGIGEIIGIIRNKYISGETDQNRKTFCTSSLVCQSTEADQLIIWQPTDDTATTPTLYTPIVIITTTNYLTCTLL